MRWYPPTSKTSPPWKPASLSCRMRSTSVSPPLKTERRCRIVLERLRQCGAEINIGRFVEARLGAVRLGKLHHFLRSRGAIEGFRPRREPHRRTSWVRFPPCYRRSPAGWARRRRVRSAPCSRLRLSPRRGWGPLGEQLPRRDRAGRDTDRISGSSTCSSRRSLLVAYLGLVPLGCLLWQAFIARRAS